jgi:hypothetical protein
MTRTNFVWNRAKWKTDYPAAYDALKAALSACVANYFPDPDSDLEVRVDACKDGIGIVVLKVIKGSGTDLAIRESPDYLPQPVAFASQALSPAARKRTTIEQEAYAIFWAVMYFAYYLWGQHFLLLTDHRNLLWMEQSKVPKIIRWRIILQFFSFTLAHIPGRRNAVVDWLSRIPSIKNTPSVAYSHANYDDKY